MRFGYVILYVHNVPETVAFYERAFGLKCRFAHENQYAEMETGGTALAFVQEKFVGDMVGEFTLNRAVAHPAGTEIGLIAENVQAAFDHAVAAGAAPHIHPLTKPWGQIVSYVRDNNGFLVEICSAMG